MSESKLDNQDLAPYLKKDAVVSIKIGTGFLEQMAAIIPILLDGKSQEDISKIEKLIQDKQPLEPWMAAIGTIQVLIRSVFEEADKEGFVEYKSLEDVVKEGIFTSDDLLSEQSQELSE